MTQASSRPRVQHDTLGSDTLAELYVKFESEKDMVLLKDHCHDIITLSTAKAQTKQKFHRLIDECTTHTKLLTTTQNFILAGMGLGV